MTAFATIYTIAGAKQEGEGYSRSATTRNLTAADDSPRRGTVHRGDRESHIQLYGLELTDVFGDIQDVMRPERERSAIEVPSCLSC
ncbi:MAG: hypothetical protein JSW34_09945, partial [Candidatus Zixiibacteriota bacterium]